MLLNTDINLIHFLNQVKHCKGEVTFHTSEGDVLNLKSLLSEYIFVSLFSDNSLLKNGSVQCAEKEDYNLLMEYLKKQ